MITPASREKTLVLTCSMTGSTVVWFQQFCRYKKMFGVVMISSLSIYGKLYFVIMHMSSSSPRRTPGKCGDFANV